MTFKEFIKELNGDRVEGELIKTVFYSLLTSVITLLVLYFIKLKQIENVIPKYGIFVFLLVLSYALITATLRQVRAYKVFACMPGMMIGMTTGMMGFLPGFYVGATNGMFTGGFFGMAIGIVLGAWSGKCCGIMGVMEGLMAGFMGGLMGAMTAVMMLNDNLKIAAVLVFIISAVLLTGLNYMIYRETKETEREKKDDHFLTVILSFILTVITIWIMVFGPKSLLFS